MQIALPRVPCWNCPEGQHSATCLDARVQSEIKDGKPVQTLLLVFEIDVNDDENVQYLAKRKYDLPIGIKSPLVTHLNEWLGSNWRKSNRQFDPELLKGRKAQVNLIHIRNASYPKPYVHIDSIWGPEDASPGHARTLVVQDD